MCSSWPTGKQGETLHTTFAEWSCYVSVWYFARLEGTCRLVRHMCVWSRCIAIELFILQSAYNCTLMCGHGFDLTTA